MSGARDNHIGGREITPIVKDRVERMFRIAERDHKMSLDVLEAETGISEGTMRGWREGRAMMPLDSFLTLALVIPNALTSLVTQSAGKTLNDIGADECDSDDAAIAALELALRWARARHPNSPGGVVITHCEKPDIKLAAGHLVDRAAKVAAG